MTEESQIEREHFTSPMGRELPIELNEVKKVASGFEVNVDGTIDFVVYGGNKNARQLKEVVNAIENTGYESEVVVSPKITGLRGVADGTTRQMGIVRAIPISGILEVVPKVGIVEQYKSGVIKASDLCRLKNGEIVRQGDIGFVQPGAKPFEPRIGRRYDTDTDYPIYRMKSLALVEEIDDMQEGSQGFLNRKGKPLNLRAYPSVSHLIE